MLVVDGSRGEGGGQILRTSLALSLVSGTPFRIERIRSRRPKPGLMRQHLTAARAAAAVGDAEVSGDALRSQELTFRPRRVRGGTHRFSVGTAGSAVLVLQTVLPALLRAEGPSEIRVTGGTHNPMSPPFEFLDRTFLPLLRRMGARVDASLERHGFVPAGGGRILLRVEPVPALRPLELLDRGELRTLSARALLARLPRHIGDRELAVLGRRLGLARGRVDEVPSDGPGNVLLVEVRSERLTEVFAAFGRRGLPAERVAETVADEAGAYLRAGVPVGPHLADQLLLPLAMAGGGAFRTTRPTRHTLTNRDVVEAFLPVRIELDPEDGEPCRVRILRRGG